MFELKASIELDEVVVTGISRRSKNSFTGSYVEVKGDENDLYWSTLDKNFFDSRQYAGYGNIGHIMELIYLYKDKQLKL